MKSSTERRSLDRQRAEDLCRYSLTELVCIVSILRSGLMRVLPLAGASAWWVTLAALLPGVGLVLLTLVIMRRAGVSTLTELARRYLGRPGVWMLCAVLGAALLLDAASTLTALIMLFTQGLGTRGTPLTLALLTAAALLPCLHRDGLPRAVHLLRRVMLIAAAIAAAAALPLYRVDHLHPLYGYGWPAVLAAFRAGWSIGWPVLLLLTLPPAGKGQRMASVSRITAGAVLPLLLVCLTAPQEALQADAVTALLLPGRYASAAVQMLLHCLLLTAFFFAIGGALHGAAELARTPSGRSLRWLPLAALALLTALQALPERDLWRLLERLSQWTLLPLAALLLILPLRRCRA